MLQDRDFEALDGVRFAVHDTAGTAEAARAAAVMAGCAAGWPFGSGWGALLVGEGRLRFDATLVGAVRAALMASTGDVDPEGLPVLAASEAARLARVRRADGLAEALEEVEGWGRPMTIVRIEAPEGEAAVAGATGVDAAVVGATGMGIVGPEARDAPGPAAAGVAAKGGAPWVVFAGRAGETSGGYHDLQGSYPNREEAVAACRGLADDPEAWWHVVHEGAIVLDCEP